MIKKNYGLLYLALLQWYLFIMHAQVLTSVAISKTSNNNPHLNFHHLLNNVCFMYIPVFTFGDCGGFARHLFCIICLTQLDSSFEKYFEYDSLVVELIHNCFGPSYFVITLLPDLFDFFVIYFLDKRPFLFLYWLFVLSIWRFYDIV